jgi:hypothetical protein
LDLCRRHHKATAEHRIRATPRTVPTTMAVVFAPCEGFVEAVALVLDTAVAPEEVASEDVAFEAVED